MSIASYVIRVVPGSHEILGELTLPDLQDGAVVLATPTWVPGAYSPMKYGRDLVEVKAFDASGRELPIQREGWSGFRVSHGGGELRVTWRAVAYDPAWGELSGIVDHEHAVLRATRYLYAPAHAGACCVNYELPSGWAIHHPGGSKIGTTTWEYSSFLALLETCVVAGKFQRITRAIDGVDFHHVFLDGAVGFETESSSFIDALMKIAIEARAIFGSFPFRDYTYVFSHNPSAHWGLEHADCTMIALGENLYIDAAARSAGVRVCAHELFHAWNVCRLKPREIAKATLIDPPTVDSLWVAEGVTRYYEFLLGVRVGELTVEQLVSNVVNYWRQLTAIPAYRRVSALDSSRASFLNHSRYPNSVNVSIDYYDAGMLIAFALDARLRAAGSSLDEKFGKFYGAHAADPDGYTHEQIVAELAADEPMRAELRRAIESAGSLDTPARLEALGFKLERKSSPYVGLLLAKENTGPEIAHVLDDSPAATTGITSGDIIQRVDGFPFSLKALRWLVEHRETVELSVLRGHRTLNFRISIGQREILSALSWSGSAAQLQLLRDWMKQPKLDWKPGQNIPLTAHDNFHGVQTVL